MVTDSVDRPNPTPAKRSAFAAAWLLAVTLLGVTVYQFALDWHNILDLRPVDLHLRGDVVEQGGWQGGPLQVESGRTVNLHVESIAGVHSFTIAHTAIHSSRPLAPGDAETVIFTAPPPGRYVLYCTTWCGPNHWRMRTVLDVVDPKNPAAVLSYRQDPLRYVVSLDPISLDMPHPASAWPAQRARASAGAAAWQALASSHQEGEILATAGWPEITPAQFVEQLQTGQIRALSGANALAPQARWDLAAYLWQRQAGQNSLTRGSRTLHAELRQLSRPKRARRWICCRHV